MRILVSVVGIGLGHATRSEAIVKELRKYGANVKIITWGDAYKYFKKKGYEPIDTGGYEYKGEEYSFNVMLNIIDSFREPNKLKKDYYKFAELADTFKPDKVLTDTDPNAFFYAHRRELPNYMVSNLTTTLNKYDLIPKPLRTRDLRLQYFMIKKMVDFIKKRIDSIFVPSFETKVRYTEPLRYTDLIIRKRYGELPSEKKIREKLEIDDDFYLVGIGGAEIEKYLFKVLRKVLPEFEDKKFVIASNYEVSKKTKEKNMTILPFIPNMLEYTKISKGIIAPAGYSTISEAICYDKPIMTVPIKNHVEQLVNAALLQKQGLGHSCFIKQKLNPTMVRLCMEEFFKKEDRIRENQKQAGFRGTGAKEIAKIIAS